MDSISVTHVEHDVNTRSRSVAEPLIALGSGRDQWWRPVSPAFAYALPAMHGQLHWSSAVAGEMNSGNARPPQSPCRGPRPMPARRPE